MIRYYHESIVCTICGAKQFGLHLTFCRQYSTYSDDLKATLIELSTFDHHGFGNDFSMAPAVRMHLHVEINIMILLAVI